MTKYFAVFIKPPNKRDSSNAVKCTDMLIFSVLHCGYLNTFGVYILLQKIIKYFFWPVKKSNLMIFEAIYKVNNLFIDQNHHFVHFHYWRMNQNAGAIWTADVLVLIKM